MSYQSERSIREEEAWSDRIHQAPSRLFTEREELQKYPKTVLLKIAIELNPDKVAESYQEGWTKDDILRIIERHLSSSLGQSGTYGGEYIQDVEILDSEVE